MVGLKIVYFRDLASLYWIDINVFKNQEIQLYNILKELNYDSNKCNHEILDVTVVLSYVTQDLNTSQPNCMKREVFLSDENGLSQSDFRFNFMFNTIADEIVFFLSYKERCFTLSRIEELSDNTIKFFNQLISRRSWFASTIDGFFNFFM